MAYAKENVIKNNAALISSWSTAATLWTAWVPIILGEVIKNYENNDGYGQLWLLMLIRI